MLRNLILGLAAGAAYMLPAAAADPAPVQLAVKPPPCVLDKVATSCMMTFDIRFKSLVAEQFCLKDSKSTDPLHCWASAVSGAWLQEREVSEEFTYWLSKAGDDDKLAEVKVTVLRVGS